MYYSINNNEFSIADKKENLTRYYDNVFELPSDYEDGKYIVENNELVLNLNWQAQKEQEEKERISKLCLTSADVERGIYKAKGMDFDDILAFVSANPPEGLDIKALKIELKANNFYRGNPYVTNIGALLGFSAEQLDKFFEDANYEHLLV
ncbi:MAG: hypothetical protein IKL52_02240 [Candidatus Gastranaerophilales bacterium]|nr:hypothetical protein [Candidatus Gastranaerophilales bacterium]